MVASNVYIQKAAAMITCYAFPIRRSLKWTVNFHRKAFHLFPLINSRMSTDSAFLPFDQLVSCRRDEAQRSLLVEVAGPTSASDLYQVCSQYGSVHKMFYYSVKFDGANKEMILVEFKELSSLNKALRFVCSLSSKYVVPAQSPFVWLAAGNPGGRTTNNDPSDFLTPSVIYSQTELMQQISQCSTISEQIQKLYDGLKLTELGWRLRFFTCRQIEVALSGVFPRAAVLPFGSSVNSFGNINCDLDMALDLSSISSEENTQRLVFQAKKYPAAARSRFRLQRHMEVISGIIDNFVPGCSQVRKILNARVPIIKYRQDLTGVDCDLSMSNRSGFYMSQMLYMYGSMDPRVRPIVFAVRRWARDRHITSPYAGRWVTNFSLTVMVLFYLMNVSPPVITSLHSLNINSDPDDEADDVKFIFPRNLIDLVVNENKDSLETLLRGFFEFYDKFNFRERGLSIVHGKSFVKPEHNALYIQNPLELELNVSRNVTLEEVERLRTELTHARFLLEGSTHTSDVGNHKRWGALCLWNEGSSVSSNHHTQEGSQNYAIDWKEVFHTSHSKLLASSAGQDGSSLKYKSEVSNSTRKENDIKIVKEDSKARKGKEQKNVKEFNGVISKLKHKALQKGNSGRRYNFTPKGKFR
ncbi:poly(A) RNA polymerase, mitochondrial-like [Panulirus ornatus]|uniref:poly(A) RNA polymerase, mitochondrial-like n=1 Tax=Panulirus ornatus TaxID=150431 RepID=UPI003A84A077